MAEQFQASFQHLWNSPAPWWPEPNHWFHCLCSRTFTLPPSLLLLQRKALHVLRGFPHTELFQIPAGWPGSYPNSYYTKICSKTYHTTSTFQVYEEAFSNWNPSFFCFASLAGLTSSAACLSKGMADAPRVSDPTQQITTVIFLKILGHHNIVSLYSTKEISKSYSLSQATINTNIIPPVDLIP